MRVRIHYRELEQSQWMDQLIIKKTSRLERYLGHLSIVEINFTQKEGHYFASISIQSGQRQQVFLGDAPNLYEAFSFALEKTIKSLSDQRRKLKDKRKKGFSALLTPQLLKDS